MWFESRYHSVLCVCVRTIILILSNAVIIAASIPSQVWGDIRIACRRVVRKRIECIFWQKGFLGPWYKMLEFLVLLPNFTARF